MKKIIKLNESELINIVRRVIVEQNKSSKTGSPSSNLESKVIEEYGKKVAKALGKNFQLAASQEDYSGEEVRGSYKSYFIQDFDYGSKWGKDGISLSFDARMFSNDKNEKLVPCSISFAVILKDGFPLRIETGFANYDNEAFSLLDKDLNEKILPKIKNIKFDLNDQKAKKCGHDSWEEYKNSGWSCLGSKKSSSVCPKGFVREEGSNYPLKSPAYCDGTLPKYPNKRVKLYDGGFAEIETKKWNHDDMRKNVSQEGKWKTDSLGNPIIYNLGPERMMTIN